jgi:hypothetical protein
MGSDDGSEQFPHPVNLAQAQFGRKEPEQMRLADCLDEGLESVKEAGPLKLSKREQRGLYALLQLHDRGLSQSKSDYSHLLDERADKPIIRCTIPDYLEAYGCGRRYAGRQAQKALEALDELAEARKFIFKWTEDGERNVVISKRPLITTDRVYADVSREDYRNPEQFEAKRADALQAELQVPAFWMLDSFYFLMPEDYLEELRSAKDQQLTRADRMLPVYLMTLNQPSHEIARDRLARKVGLGNYIDRRHKKKAWSKLEDALELAKKANYLQVWELKTDQFGAPKYHLELNPERCSRVPELPDEDS